MSTRSCPDISLMNVRVGVQFDEGDCTDRPYTAMRGTYTGSCHFLQIVSPSCCMATTQLVWP